MDRINLRDSRSVKVLKWISFAIRPLHIDELREAVAFDLQDTVWDAGKIPQRAFVIGCCANLVVLDPIDDCIYFAHSSVKYYLEKDRANFILGYPSSAVQGELECGEFCIAYLSFPNFGLELEKHEKVAINVPNPMSLAGQSLPSPLGKLFFRASGIPQRSASIQFRQIRPVSTPDRSQYKFLDYATVNWA